MYMYKTLYFYILELLECMLLLFYRLRQDIEELTTVIFEYSRIYLVYLEGHMVGNFSYPDSV